MKNRSRRSGPSVPRTTPVIVTGTMSAIPASPFPPPWRQASRVIRGQRSLVPRTAKGPRTAKRPADRALRLAADADDRVVVFRARAVRGPSRGGDEAGRREGQAVEEGADLLRAAQVVGARRVLVVGVIVVAGQHQVHRPELVLGDRRPGGLGEVAVGAGGVEGGVADDAQATEVED